MSYSTCPLIRFIMPCASCQHALPLNLQSYSSACNVLQAEWNGCCSHDAYDCSMLPAMADLCRSMWQSAVHGLQAVEEGMQRSMPRGGRRRSARQTRTPSLQMRTMGLITSLERMLMSLRSVSIGMQRPCHEGLVSIRPESTDKHDLLARDGGMVVGQ